MYIHRSSHCQRLLITLILGIVLSYNFSPLNLFLAPLHAQEITRVAVLDYAKVLREYSTQSKELQRINNLKQEVQKEMDKLKQQLDNLQTELRQAQETADNTQVRNIRDEINRQRDYGRKYLDNRNEEIKTLREQANSPERSNDIQKILPDVIAQVAREHGYSLILDKTHQGLIWLDISIDITQIVLQRLKKRFDETS